MFRRSLIPVWIGIILLSGMFLMGQDGGWGIQTTEIVSVCNGFFCELIEPEQEEAQIELTGTSSIHLISDFFSEATLVDLCYTTDTEICFDITDLCEITQYPEPDTRNRIETTFDARRLPVPPETWVHYSITLNPMPPPPPDAKTSDSLWILTHGGGLIE